MTTCSWAARSWHPVERSGEPSQARGKAEEGMDAVGYSGWEGGSQLLKSHQTWGDGVCCKTLRMPRGRHQVKD